jgi:DNA (cytosine-5)-methyltransferase 1
MLIKSRRAKNSSRGIYLQDRQLLDTVFQPGSHYKYVIDVVSKKLVILSTEDKFNTVSKRVKNHSTNPVIDIRNKEALAAFNGCEFLQVEIHEDQIVVSGFDAVEPTVISKAKRVFNKLVGRRSKVTDITQLLNVKKKYEVVLSKSELSQVVGGYEQLSFSFAEESRYQPSSLAYIHSALKHLHIPLLIDSLFTGAGLMDIGFMKAGFEVAFAVELNGDAVKTYSANLGKHIMQADITEVEKERFTSPIMIGGSPCQGFSNSNRYTNFLDNPNNKLLRAYIDAVKANKNCQVFVLENVPQILTAGNGQFKKEILQELSDFEINCAVLNSADYGAAQLRKRAIFIGSKIGAIKLPKPEFEPSNYVTVEEAFRGLHERMPNQMDISVPKQLTLKRIKSVPPGGNVHDIPESFRPSGQHSDMYKRLEWKKPSITIVNPRKAMLLHPEEDRILSVRECARIQGVDDDFVFHGKLDSKQQQVANGVPIKLTEAIAIVIRQAITRFNIRHRSEPVMI